MACRIGTMVEAYGDWIKKDSQNPPNASQANRDAAQDSAEAAAAASAARHCKRGNRRCGQNGRCIAVETDHPEPEITFEDGVSVHDHVIRCRIKARFQCECEGNAANDNDDQDSGQQQQQKQNKKIARG